jgi:hypothetical protein
MKKIVAILLTLHFCSAFAQEMMTFKGGKQLIGTPTWNFICDDYAYTGILKVQLAKNDKGGILKLSIQVSNNQLYIGDRAYIILENGTYIYCADKGIRDTISNESNTYYNLSIAEINKLKSSPIASIRFRIIGTESKFSSQTGYFTAINKIEYFDPYDKSKNTYLTNVDLKAINK